MLGASWLSAGTSSTFPPVKLPVPAGFAADDYPPIETLVQTGTISARDISRYGRYAEARRLPELNAVYLRFDNGARGQTFVFVNASGDVFGSIRGDRTLQAMGNVIVGLDGYYNISADGVSTKQRYEVVPASPDLAALEALVNQATLYRQYRWTDVPAGRSEHAQKGVTTHVMLHDGVWKKMSTPFHAFVSWKTPPLHDLTTQHLLWSDRTEGFPIGNYQLHRVFFDQRDYVPCTISGSGPGTEDMVNGGEPEHWRGTGYYTLSVGSRKQSFLIENDVLNLSSSGPLNLTIQGAEELEFILFQHLSRSGVKYLISQN